MKNCILRGKEEANEKAKLENSVTKRFINYMRATKCECGSEIERKKNKTADMM